MDEIEQLIADRLASSRPLKIEGITIFEAE